MHFFNKPKLKFYGRSYVSSGIELVPNRSTGALETVEPLNVYFHSTLGRGTDNIIIAEAVIVGNAETLSFFLSNHFYCRIDGSWRC